MVLDTLNVRLLFKLFTYLMRSVLPWEPAVCCKILHDASLPHAQCKIAVGSPYILAKCSGLAEYHTLSIQFNDIDELIGNVKAAFKVRFLNITITT